GEKSARACHWWQAAKVCGRRGLTTSPIRYTAAMDYGMKARTKWRRLMRLRLMLPTVLALTVMAGCQQATRVERAKDSTRQEAAKIAESGNVKRTAAAVVERPGDAQQVKFAEAPSDDLGGGQLIEETWDAISMQGKRVGYV